MLYVIALKHYEPLIKCVASISTLIPLHDNINQYYVILNEWMNDSIGMKIYKAKSNIKTKQHIYITYMKLYMNKISRFMANSQS
jgi:hypothetical protein